MRKKPQKNKYPKPRKKVQFRASFFQKGIDFFEKRCIIYLLRKALRDPREWRNWQTRTFEGRVDNTVRVQVPFLAPSKAAEWLLCLYHKKNYNVVCAEAIPTYRYVYN